MVETCSASTTVANRSPSVHVSVSNWGQKLTGNKSTILMHETQQGGSPQATHGTITRLQIQQKNKERVNIFLNDEYAFSLDLMLALGLKKGQTLSAAEVTALQAQDEGKRAYAAAVNLLGYRARSQSEVEQRLQQRDFSAPAIAQTVDRLRSEGHLDDANFGQLWVESRQRSSPRGARALRYELRQKGLDPAVIDTVIDNTEIDETAAAWIAIEPKLDRWRALERFPFQQKVSGFLARRGFGHDAVRAVVDRAWQQVQAEQADEEL